MFFYIYVIFKNIYIMKYKAREIAPRAVRRIEHYMFDSCSHMTSEATLVVDLVVLNTIFWASLSLRPSTS